MTWGWARFTKDRWEFDGQWAVVCHWATKRWYIERDGAALLVDYDSAIEAIEAADVMRIAQKEPGSL